MSNTDTSTETFVQQVEEEVRRERWSQFFKKWGWWIGGALAAIILAVAGYEVYKSVTSSAAADAGQQFSEAQAKLAQGDDAAARQTLTRLSMSGPGAYRAAAMVERATALEAANDLPNALKAFDEAARLTDAPALKASISLRAAYLAAEIESFAALQTRLKPLVDAGGPYALLARELIGVEAVEAGQNDVAIREFTAIRDALDAPQSMQQRASEFLLAVPPPPAKPAAPTLSPAPAAPAASTGDKK